MATARRMRTSSKGALAVLNTTVPPPLTSTLA
jgi:hypothetical protein